MAAVICMLYKIRYKGMYPLYSGLLEPYVPVLVTRGAVIAHRFTYAPSRCRTSQYRMTFISILVSLCNNLCDLVSDSMGLAGFKSR